MNNALIEVFVFALYDKNIKHFLVKFFYLVKNILYFWCNLSGTEFWILFSLKVSASKIWDYVLSSIKAQIKKDSTKHRNEFIFNKTLSLRKNLSI